MKFLNSGSPNSSAKAGLFYVKLMILERIHCKEFDYLVTVFLAVIQIEGTIADIKNKGRKVTISKQKTMQHNWIRLKGREYVL